MGDFIPYNDRTLETGKTYMQFWLHMVVQEIDNLSDPPPWLITARHIWDEQSHSYVGELAPDFDYILTSEDRMQVVVKLLRRAIDQVNGFGQTISRDDLNRMELGGESGSKFFKDVAVKDYVGVGNALIRLLSTSETGGDPAIRASTHTAESAKWRKDYLASYGGDADAAMREMAEEWQRFRGKESR